MTGPSSCHAECHVDHGPAPPAPPSSALPGPPRDLASRRRRLLRGLTLVGALAAVLSAPPAASSGDRDVRGPAALADTVLAAATADLGHDRIGVRRADAWYPRDALDGGPSRGYREDAAGWTPVAGDFDGDGNGSVALFSGGTFRLRDEFFGLHRAPPSAPPPTGGSCSSWSRAASPATAAA